LRDEHFIGTVKMVMNFFTYVATEVREIMAQLGVRTMEELVGRTDLLNFKEAQTDKQRNLDLLPLLSTAGIPESAPHVCQQDRNEPYDKGELAERMVHETLAAIETKQGGEFSFNVTNCDRSIGARLSGEIAWRHGNQGMADAPITLKLNGTAGQSFGVWNAGGLNMSLEGDANDYVGKGMAGGKLSIYPPVGSVFKSNETPIVGNTCLYGATGGKLFAAGTAGERFAVRNSGATAVIEGAGDHCCEYMTGGCVVVLGKTGYNFGAGMTGGLSYVLDLDNTFVDHVNQELVEFSRITSESNEVSRDHLVGLLEEFVAETNSEWGSHILNNFDDYARKFWLVKPKAASVSELIANVTKRAA